MNLKDYNVNMATHFLECSHQIGSNYKYYNMKCILLGKTKSGKCKIVVFGDRNWMDTDHVKKIRYVDNYRIKK